MLRTVLAALLATALGQTPRPGSVTLDVELTPAPLVEVLYVVPEPADAYRRADVIALLRIDRGLPPEPCGPLVTSTYEATVLAVIKGTPPPSILLVQDAAGVCLDDGREIRGTGRAFQEGEEYLLFLQRKGDRFVRLGGSGLTFRAADGRVETRGYGGLPSRMTVGKMQAALEAGLFTISGAVTDKQGRPIRNVIIGVGPEHLTTDADGRYRLALPPGRHRVVAGRAGYRHQRRDVTLTGDAVVDFALVPGDIVAVDFISLGPQEAHRQADAIARLRIARSLPPQPCDRTVSVTHEAAVLDVIKGDLPSAILFEQRGAGVCLQENGVELEGTDRPFGPAEEYVVFLRRDGAKFEDLTGPWLTFKVENGLVDTRGYAGLPPTLPLADFYDAVRRMGR